MIEFKAYASSSKGNLYKVSDFTTSLLIDPGLPVKKIKEALNFKLSEIQGCLVSHEHMDHARAAKDLSKAGIDCYMSKGTADALELSGHRVHIISPLVPFRVKSCQILPFPTIHDSAEPMGFLLNTGNAKILYAIDTQYIAPRFVGLTHIMIECNYDMNILRENSARGLIDIALAKKVIKNHMSLSTCKEFFKANDMAKVREIHLLHLSLHNSDAERFREEIMKVSGRPTYIAGG